MSTATYPDFTDRARHVMQLAGEEAVRRYQEYVGTEHILLGIAREAHGVGGYALDHLELTLDLLRNEIAGIVESGTYAATSPILPLTPRARRTLELAREECRALGHNYVGTEHLLLGLTRDHETVAFQVLSNLGVMPSELREFVFDILGYSDCAANPGDH